ncbi:MAG TPA: DUF1003 domain-containing protein [Myxococcota bacterium]|jgi:uncharacterized membrane protein|nr:DUF1003 domain-containing protein [Myxococcota bacterium]
MADGSSGAGGLPRDTADDVAEGAEEDLRCAVCGRAEPRERLVRIEGVRPEIAERLAAAHPESWPKTGYIGLPCLTAARLEYEMDRLAEERGALSAVEEAVARQALDHEVIARDLTAEFERSTTVGQRAADRIAAWGGSWSFLGGFAFVLAAWIVVNAILLRGGAFDPYPFILLNLVLSCLAAVQAPVILMSQNRQAARDRLQADHDFRVNLKAEIEVKTLHEKVDHLLHVQWERMVELQELQIDMLRTLVEMRERRADAGDE